MSTGLTVFDHLMGEGFTIRKSGFVEVGQSVTTESVVAVIQKMQALNENATQLRKLIAIAVGSLVLEHAARMKCTLTETVDNLEICKNYDVATKTVLKWAKIVSIVPEAVLELPNLHIAHFDAATSYAGPKDVDDVKRFNRARDRMLQEINEDPTDKGKRFVEDQMKALKTKFGSLPQRQESIGNVMKKLIWALRILRLAREVRQPILDKYGKTDIDLVAMIRGWEDELCIRKQMPDDVSSAAIPWLIEPDKKS